MLIVQPRHLGLVLLFELRQHALILVGELLCGLLLFSLELVGYGLEMLAMLTVEIV